MRVLLIHSFWHPRGGDTTSLQIQREALQARGHDVVAFGMRHPDNVPEPGDAAWPGWRDAQPWGVASALWSRAAARALCRVLRAAPVDVAHVHHLHRHLTLSVLPVLAAARVPVVWTLHDYEWSCPTGRHYRAGAPCFACTPDTLLPALRHGCTRGLERPVPVESAMLVAEKRIHRVLRPERDVAAFIAPSRFLAEQVRGVLPGARLVHLPNPVLLPPSSELQRRGVVFASRFVEEKGVDETITLAAAFPETSFTLLGDGPLLASVRARRLPNVAAPGAVPREAVGAALLRAQAVLVPSRWPENDPYAVTEAQAAGAVVLASSIGGIPEQIDDGRDGLLCPAGAVTGWIAPLRQILGDPALAAQIGDRARARIARERDPVATAIALEELYNSLRFPGASP